jgi:hypothetical protein
VTPRSRAFEERSCGKKIFYTLKKYKSFHTKQGIFYGCPKMFSS